MAVFILCQRKPFSQTLGHDGCISYIQEQNPLSVCVTELYFDEGSWMYLAYQ